MMCSIDFETYYDKEYGLKEMSASQYCRDARFDAYCVSFSREDGRKYSGPPKDFDWNLIRGCIVFMHNATFDELVLKRLQDDGVAPKDLDIEIVDTADMAAYFGSMRNLKSAAKNFLGLDLQKDTRDKMKGKTWEDVSGTNLGTELLRYAQQDADSTLALGMKLLPLWPDIERKVSALSRRGGQRGLPLDLEYLEYSKKHLDKLVFEYLQSIPWYPQEKPLSVPAMREEARKNGMWFPGSLDMRDVKAEEWVETYKEKYPWVMAIRNFRRCNTIANRVRNLWEGRRGDVFPFELMYFGAGTTGRWSGGGVVLRRRWASGKEESGGKFNPQNMMRDPMFGVNLRYCLMAPPGKKFYVVDYNQIECRLLLWTVGDTKMLEKIRGGMSPYVAFAVSFLGAKPDVSKQDRLYLSGKACVLGGGYQAGTSAFQRTAKNLAGLDLSLEEAERLKNLYREQNPKVVALWAKHQKCLGFSANASDPTHEVELASGRVLTYYNPHTEGLTKWGTPQYVVSYTQGEEPDKIYGGLITENQMQATARDILRDGWVALDAAGFDVPLTVHDEYVIVGPDSGEKEFKQEIRNVLAKSSPWAEGCPLTVGIEVSDHYVK